MKSGFFQAKTKALFVQSKFSNAGFWNYVDVCEITGEKYTASPLGLMTVAALLPQHWEFKLVDVNVEPLTDDHFKWADIVFAGGMLPQQNEILKIINRAHPFGRPAAVGGLDPTSQPKVYESADFLVTGEGEIAIPVVIIMGRFDENYMKFRPSCIIHLKST
jgi:radical SAM superfamily enzyme YgiQ (UPF0313 family)